MNTVGESLHAAALAYREAEDVEGIAHALARQIADVNYLPRGLWCQECDDTEARVYCGGRYQCLPCAVTEMPELAAGAVSLPEWDEIQRVARLDTGSDVNHKGETRWNKDPRHSTVSAAHWFALLGKDVPADLEGEILHILNGHAYRADLCPLCEPKDRR